MPSYVHNKNSFINPCSAIIHAAMNPDEKVCEVARNESTIKRRASNYKRGKNACINLCSAIIHTAVNPDQEACEGIMKAQIRNTVCSGSRSERWASFC